MKSVDPSRLAAFVERVISPHPVARPVRYRRVIHRSINLNYNGLSIWGGETVRETSIVLVNAAVYPIDYGVLPGNANRFPGVFVFARDGAPKGMGVGYMFEQPSDALLEDLELLGFHVSVSALPLEESGLLRLRPLLNRARDANLDLVSHIPDGVVRYQGYCQIVRSLMSCENTAPRWVIVRDQRHIQ